MIVDFAAFLQVVAFVGGESSPEPHGRGPMPAAECRAIRHDALSTAAVSRLRRRVWRARFIPWRSPEGQPSNPCWRCRPESTSMWRSLAVRIRTRRSWSWRRSYRVGWEPTAWAGGWTGVSRPRCP